MAKKYSNGQWPKILHLPILAARYSSPNARDSGGPTGLEQRDQVGRLGSEANSTGAPGHLSGDEQNVSRQERTSVSSISFAFVSEAMAFSSVVRSFVDVFTNSSNCQRQGWVAGSEMPPAAGRPIHARRRSRCTAWHAWRRARMPPLWTNATPSPAARCAASAPRGSGRGCGCAPDATPRQGAAR